MKIRLISAVLTLALAGAAAIQPALADDKTIATIDDKPITQADIDIADSEIGSDMGTLAPLQKKMSLLEFLIDNQLFAEAAEKEKLDQGPEFEARLLYLKRRALREIYFEKVLKASVTEADARKLYDEQVKKLKPEEEVSARHILVQTEKEAQDIKKRIDAGEDFAKLATELSKDPGSADDGGNLGYFGHGQMVPEFEQVVFKLKKGEVSAPVKTQFGWHLIKIEDQRLRKPPAFDVVKDRIIQSELLRKAQEKAMALRTAAKIKITDPELQKALDDRNKQMEDAGKEIAKQKEEAAKKAEEDKKAAADKAGEAAKPAEQAPEKK